MATQRSVTDRLAELEAKRSQLNARIEKLSARETTLRRRQDNRRAMLLGRLMLADLRNPDRAGGVRDYVSTRLREALTVAGDLSLFSDLIGEPEPLK